MRAAAQVLQRLLSTLAMLLAAREKACAFYDETFLLVATWQDRGGGHSIAPSPWREGWRGQLQGCARPCWPQRGGKGRTGTERGGTGGRQGIRQRLHR